MGFDHSGLLNEGGGNFRIVISLYAGAGETGGSHNADSVLTKQGFDGKVKREAEGQEGVNEGIEEGKEAGEH